MLANTKSGERRLPAFWIVAALLLLKLSLLRYWLYGGVTVKHLPADIASLLAVLGLAGLITPRRWRSAAYAAVDVLLSVLLFAVTVYHAYYGSIPTYTALKALDQVGQVRASVDSLIEPEYYVYFADFVLLLLLYGIRRRLGRRRTAGSYSGSRGRNWLIAGTVAGLVVSSLYVNGSRTVSNEKVQAERLGLLNYEVAAAVQVGREVLAAQNGSLEETKAKVRELQAAYPYRDGAAAASATAGEAPHFGAAKGMNVVVVQLEAFQNFPLRLSVGGVPVTPVMNGLADESFYFPHIYQQIGQGNTVDAEFMSATSVYPTGKIAMSTGYGDRELPSIQRLLRDQGYESMTFHINDVSFWDRSKLYPALGFDRYYDKPNFSNDHFNDFGASDEELFRIGLDELGKRQQQGKPFYAQFVTASSHFPFKVPEDRQRLALPDGLAGTFLGDYLEAVSYADYALGTLIDGLKAKGLWENTLLVVYGDHFGLQPEKASDEFIRSQLGIRYDSRVSRFNIPLIVHAPGVKGERVERTGGQLDIMPTVAGLLGQSLEKADYTAFGQNLLGIDRNVIGMRYYLPTGSFFNDDVLFLPGKGFDDGTAVDLDTLEPVKDIAPYRSDYHYVMELMGLSDEYVRQLPKRSP